jgi:DNA-binding transcriptional regulator YdaS (Cro superfamily)
LSVTKLLLIIGCDLVHYGAMTQFEAFQQAVRLAGGQAQFGRVVGLTQQKIWYYLSKRRPLPAEYVLAAERGTGVSRHLLRPDIYPVPASTLEAAE